MSYEDIPASLTCGKKPICLLAYLLSLQGQYNHFAQKKLLKNIVAKHMQMNRKFKLTLEKIAYRSYGIVFMHCSCVAIISFNAYLYKSTFSTESAKLRAKRVKNVLTYQRCLACLRAHVPCVPTCLACLHAHIPTCLAW